MTAATLTPAAAGADLLDQLRQLVARFGDDGSASSVDEVRQICDELTAVLRRARGRITRLARQESEQPKPEPKPAPAAEATRVEQPERRPPVPASPPAPPRAEVRLPREPEPRPAPQPKPLLDAPDAPREPEPQQQPPPKLPKDAPDAPREPLPLAGPRSWWAWLAAALLAVLAVVGAVWRPVRARAVRWSRRAAHACRSAVAQLRAAVRRSP